MHKKIHKCRICGNTNLVSLLDLGRQSLTGVFPKTKTEKITRGPLQLVKCMPRKGEKVCGLVQLLHSYDSKEMYGTNYGYRSGLNQSMVKHLNGIVDEICARINFSNGDLIIDIGSNDSTLLQSYSRDLKSTLVGIDPTGTKFAKYYPDRIKLIPDFFSAAAISKNFPGRKAKVVTSIAMFYDLENPISFAAQVREVLDENGVWAFEQSYLPTMLASHSYDTVCHEHLEYYTLKQINWIASKAGLKIIDVSLNDVNGGSFRVTAAQAQSKFKVNSIRINKFLADEKKLDKMQSYTPFVKSVKKHKDELQKLIQKLKKGNKKILGYGASTKGNVILQYCKLTEKDIPCIAEINEDKFGSFTSYTHIPIVSEQKAQTMKPDYFLVLPWHFRKGIIEREKEFLKRGGKLIFPLPEISIVSHKGKRQEKK